MQDPFGTTNYTYYADHSLWTLTDPNGFVITYNKYDAAGNLEELIYPGGKKVIYTYDELNRLKTVTIDWLSPKPVATYNYDDAGRLTSLTNFNGTVTTYGYDNANRLNALENKKSDTTTILASYGFTLDGNGNRTQTVQTEPLTLTPSADTVTYGYNAKKNRLLTANTINFIYDDEGQLLWSKDGADTYMFDEAHRLTHIYSGSYYAEFSYDGAGNRLRANRDWINTSYVYDAGGNLLMEVDDSRGTFYYIHGMGLMAMVTDTGNVYTYHFNAVGSTIAMTDSTQAIVNKYSYDPFGNIAANSIENVQQPFKFVGQYGVMTEPNGFYYMRARYYDPQIGRFISEDPIGFEGGDVNLMAYVGNNPVLLIDPLGLKWLAGKDDPYVMGSVNAIPGLQPGDSAMVSFERYVPNFYETSKQHDALLGYMGIKDAYKNLPTAAVTIITMPITFATALVTNIYQTLTGTEETIFGNKSNSPTRNSYNPKP